ncbi:OmpA family protein [Pseudotabrizicola alkalilacus]|uniref:OmpA family protein n=1 Tax=Pseudotabrizicola alkalilacus TaxID=2305252 RepID=A0A411Z5U2_9RHOB|nr:OmpA family protein [Pseudotabrizicola alkalilacus]RGP38419.1 OmpA family protein [Pseudotabrizicola alkalilacus]
MTFKTPLLFSAASLLALTACVDPNAYPDNPNARTQQGAIMGGLVGAAAGASGGGSDSFRKAVVGGVIGAAAGGAIGATLDRQAAELRSSINNPNVTVTNNGDYLTVNLPQDLLFAVDSTALRPDLRSDLGSVAQSLIRYPNSRIEVIGHTDNTGSAAYNYDLSQRRASAVSSVLTQNGVPFNRITNIGRGFDQPIASNATPQGRAQNRRVEILIRPTS